jgi:hypothetical protein
MKLAIVLLIMLVPGVAGESIPFQAPTGWIIEDVDGASYGSGELSRDNAGVAWVNLSQGNASLLVPVQFMGTTTTDLLALVSFLQPTADSILEGVQGIQTAQENQVTAADLDAVSVAALNAQDEAQAARELVQEALTRPLLQEDAGEAMAGLEDRVQSLAVMQWLLLAGIVGVAAWEVVQARRDAPRAQTHRPNARVAEEEAPVVMEAGDGATNN